MNKLIIFNCDGVLVDSEIIANRIDAKLLTTFGYPITIEECIKKFTGINFKTVRDIIFKEKKINLPENFEELSIQGTLAAFKNELKSLIPLVLEKLDSTNVKKCIASSSLRTRLLHSLELTDTLPFFPHSTIFTSEQVKNGKPAPDLFLFAMEQMGCSPEDCLVIEDSIAGINAAKAAKMYVVGFLGGAHTQFNWYKKEIYDQKIPVAHNQNDLQIFIDKFIQEKD